MSWLISKYFKSDQYEKLANKETYKLYAKNIENTNLKGGKLFGQVRIDLIKPPVIRRYLDDRDKKINANREIQFLSSVFSWGYERGHCRTNPCKGVRLNKETARTRLVEYDLVYKIALEMKSIFTPAMEIAYLCRARRGEIFNLTRSDEKEEGLYIARTKGSIPEITLWNDRLRLAVKLAKRHNKKVISPYLTHRKDGRAYTKNALDSAWQRVIKKLWIMDWKKSFIFMILRLWEFLTMRLIMVVTRVKRQRLFIYAKLIKLKQLAYRNVNSK